MSAQAYYQSLRAFTSDVSDRGANLMSDEVKSFLESLGARKYETTPYKPSSNGSVERFHRFLMSAVSHCIDDMDGKGTNQNQWDEHLGAVLLTYRVRFGHLTVRNHL